MSSTPVIIRDENGNKATKLYTDAELDLLMLASTTGQALGSLPSDESLNHADCFQVNVRVQP